MQKRLGFVLGCGIAVGTLGVVSVLPANEAAATGLVSFGSCSEVLSHLKEEARERVSPWGLNVGYPGDILEFAEEASAADDTSAGTSDGASSYSTTNVQEAGVDEPDIVKTDGRLIVTATGPTLRIVDVTGSEPSEVGELSLSKGWAESSLFLSGDRALVFVREHSTVHYETFDSYPSWWDSMTTTMHLIDLRDPSNPVIESSLRVDGDYLDARLIGDTVRVVVSSPPTLRFPVIDNAESPDELLEHMRKAVDESSIEDWLPAYNLVTADGPETSGQLVDCDRLNRPTEFGGLSTISVLTLDMDGLSAGDAVGVLTDGDTVYASTDQLYVATPVWGEYNDTPATDTADAAVDMAFAPSHGVRSTGIHAFDIRGDAAAEYLASGEVDGQIIGRYAMSEYDGVLRVATTTEANDASSSESHLITLALRDGELKQLGHVGGLGKGERIYAVRYFGDMGYVVTFREVDPLYVLDLSDPAAPSVDGELKITGYSSYLHGVGDGRLVGVGQEATETGNMIGSQVSLFDVSQRTSPRKLDGHVLEGAWSDAETNPHAFLFWPETGQLVVPVAGMGIVEADSDDAFDAAPESGALVLVVDEDSLTEQGIITHGGPELNPEYHWTTITRSLVIGDSLYTLWNDGLQVNTLDDLDFQSWLPIDDEWY
ncbi:beta-propeller domain-containing protein [Phytoactinopolyspora mesophila]|uniref:Benzoate transporter n=1 Tax=Phytoactinopolyspora mesophila TaxID=2650750 RepID=A0A7K3MAE6_9ACTN|nr:beta-propeller domain-containing protein [Phytoactinopolyspora mesophila]NDL60263.1 hypothetical protein [Phytoactinopolyspora mesophila]